MADENKNNFDKKVQMHLACAKDNPSRREMECIFFKDGFAYATDTHVIVRNRISEISKLNGAEIEALDGKFLHASFYKDMLKYDNIMIAEDGIECSKGSDKVFFYFSKFENYPDAEKVLQNALCKSPIPTPEVGLNLNQLQQLYKALYKSDQCKARFKGINNPIIFDSIAEDVSSIGLILPIITTASE